MTTEQLGMFADDLQPGEFVLPDDAQRSVCRSCDKPVAWILTDSGARMPLDSSTARTLSDGRRVALSHFATCPHAGGWRKRK